MANEIRVIEVPGPGRPYGRFLFLYPVSPRIITFTGQEIIPTPSTGLSSEITDLGLVSAGEQAALDVGDAYFKEERVVLNQSQILNIHLGLRKIREKYKEGLAEIEGLRQRYANVGRRFNAEAPTFPMPDLTGMDLETAKAQLTADKLELRRTRYVPHPTVPSGLIIRHAPAPGAFVVAGDPVDVELSLGPDEA